MERYRITTSEIGVEAADVEQTWVLLPDRASAVMQAEELANRRKKTRVRVYRETITADLQVIQELDLDLNASSAK